MHITTGNNTQILTGNFREELCTLVHSLIVSKHVISLNDTSGQSPVF